MFCCSKSSCSSTLSQTPHLQCTQCAWRNARSQSTAAPALPLQQQWASPLTCLKSKLRSMTSFRDRHSTLLTRHSNPVPQRPACIVRQPSYQSRRSMQGDSDYRRNHRQLAIAPFHSPQRKCSSSRWQESRPSRPLSRHRCQQHTKRSVERAER